jgi:putative oxidoreductase
MTSQALTRQRPAGTHALTRLLATDRALAPFVLRLALALVMLPHGAQKALGMFGGHGWSGTMGFLTGTIGMPAVTAAGVILLELLGPLALFAGFATRAVSLGFVGLMVGAIATVHLPHGFFMNWGGTQAGEGFEYHLLVIGMASALAMAGGGRWSIDRRLAARAG